MSVSTPENKPFYLDVLPVPSLSSIYVADLFEDYRQCYLKSNELKAFVESSSRIPVYLKGHDFIGACNRTAGQRIKKARTLEGGAKRGSLLREGLLIPPHCGELFRGCIVFPELNESDEIIAAIGYRFGKRIRKEQTAIVHWERPNPDMFVSEGIDLARGLINGKTYH